MQAGLPSARSLDPTLIIDAPKRASATGHLGRTGRTLPRWRRRGKAPPLLRADLDCWAAVLALDLAAARGGTRVPQLKATQKGLEGTVGLSTPHQAVSSEGGGWSGGLGVGGAVSRWGQQRKRQGRQRAKVGTAVTQSLLAGRRAHTAQSSMCLWTVSRCTAPPSPASVRGTEPAPTSRGGVLLSGRNLRAASGAVPGRLGGWKSKQGWC